MAMVRKHLRRAAGRQFRAAPVTEAGKSNLVTTNIQPQVGRNADRTLTVLFAENPRKHGQQDVNDD
jgi:hypothetical protein